MSKSFMAFQETGISTDKTCVEHSIFLCNKCLMLEVDRLRVDLAEARMTLASVGNIIGGPVAPFCDEIRFKERGDRIDRAAEVIAASLRGIGGDFRELLADLCHQQWSHWMIYLFSKCEKSDVDEGEEWDGTYFIPAWAVARWRLQMIVPYKNLSESEQESDRTEADKFIQVIDRAIP